MRRRAFTLIELLVVIAIMGMMGTISVGGYRAMRRGMEERSVMQNANMFIRSAYQRAQIDRAPVSVYFWNETLRDASDAFDTPIVVGRAVAIRRSGRISKVQGSYLYDEFGDLKYNRIVLDEDSGIGDASDSGSTSEGEGVYLYRINGDEGSQPKRSVVSSTTKKQVTSEPLLLGGDNTQAQIESYSYVLIDKNGVDWRAGDAYGFEFADITLPRGYIFGPSWSRTISSPVAGETVVRFRVGVNSGSGATQGTDGTSTVTIYSLRPDKSGGISAQKVETTENPTKRLDN